jgi:hypothetical protein
MSDTRTWRWGEHCPRARAVRRDRGARIRVQKERSESQFGRKTGVSVAEFLERWNNDYVDVHLRAKTAQGYRAIIRVRLVPALGI